ncbi:MAG: sarcosine oxidase subunit alpha [Proteobacteria bacterium]|nr:MAG: sarcosine oxidase subunit alpha [Pseudomonadota bacterium]
MSAKRLASGGRIDRNKPLMFSWEGKAYIGYEGDTLASALLANNQYTLGRSFKYHRPRGIMSAGVEESGAILTVGRGNRRDPNVKATQQRLYAGLIANGQNAWPSVQNDLHAINGVFGRFFSAGFYYKTFMGLPPFEWGKGTGLWMKYEKIIRKAAGMGEASREADPDKYDHAHGFCDVLVVGSGPSGMAAALTAAQAGLDVWLVEQDSEPGGDLLNCEDDESETHRQQQLSALKAAGVRLMPHTTAFGLYDYGTVGLLESVTDHLTYPEPHQARQRFWTVRAKQTILATGAIERHLAFGNNDKPGIMTANAGRAYLNRYGVLPGERVIVATNNDSAYVVAAELAEAGAQVTLLDARHDVSESLKATVQHHRITRRFATIPLRARGGRRINKLETATGDGKNWQKADSIPCDLLLVSAGWSPVVNLISHRSVRPVWNDELACFIAPEIKEPIYMAGAAAAAWNRQACEDSGRFAAEKAIAACSKGDTWQTGLVDGAVTSSGKSQEIADGAVTSVSKNQKIVDTAGSTENPAPVIGGWENPILPLYEIKIPGKKYKCFVDPQHDVTTDDIRLAHQEGFVSVEHLKRYTTLGMATDGGKMGNVIGLALMAEALGREIPEVGTTTFRPPYTPVSIGALRGRNVDHHFRPVRRTPLHEWNLQHGATMTDAGLWQRPWYFAREGETMTEAAIREATTVRKTVGLCDVTSLGKIAIQGPDATELLNRVYSNPFAKLPVGKARYGVMLRDDGIVMDDGTTWRLSETDYFMTTTTAHAAKVMAFLEELLQTRWQDLKVHVTSVSEQWAGCAIAGPKSREVLSACMEDPALVSNEALPFMGVLNATLKGGIPCRIARISFSGERAFETYVPSDYGAAMMDLLWGAAQPLDGCLYGLEALGTLRIEKGHVTGAELDGRVTIDDVGLGKMASANKSFIGSSLRQRPELVREGRQQLVGIFPQDRSKTFNAGAILCCEDRVSGFGEGRITSVTYSPALGHWIGLGFIEGGHKAWADKTVVAADPVRDGSVQVEVVSPYMYDPSGERMHG